MLSASSKHYIVTFVQYFNTFEQDAELWLSIPWMLSARLQVVAEIIFSQKWTLTGRGLLTKRLIFQTSPEQFYIDTMKWTYREDQNFLSIHLDFAEGRKLVIFTDGWIDFRGMIAIVMGYMRFLKHLLDQTLFFKFPWLLAELLRMLWSHAEHVTGNQGNEGWKAVWQHYETIWKTRIGKTNRNVNFQFFRVLSICIAAKWSGNLISRKAICSEFMILNGEIDVLYF